VHESSCWSKFHRLLIRRYIGEGVCMQASVYKIQIRTANSFVQIRTFAESRSSTVLTGRKIDGATSILSHLFFLSLRSRQRKRSVRGETCVEVHANLKQTVHQSEHTAMTEAEGMALIYTTNINRLQRSADRRRKKTAVHASHKLRRNLYTAVEIDATQISRNCRHISLLMRIMCCIH